MTYVVVKIDTVAERESYAEAEKARDEYYKKTGYMCNILEDGTIID